MGKQRQSLCLPQECQQFGLNLRQYKFALAIFRDPRNATNAAISAGYSPKCAKIQASNLLTQPNICKFLAYLNEKSLSNVILDVKSLRQILSSAILTQFDAFQAESKLILLAPERNRTLGALVTACNELSRMIGGHEPQKFETTHKYQADDLLKALGPAIFQLQKEQRERLLIKAGEASEADLNGRVANVQLCEDVSQLQNQVDGDPCHQISNEESTT
jgi:hypothetical protein